MILILLFGGLETWRRWQASASRPRLASSTACGRATRWRSRRSISGLAGALAVGMDATFVERDFGDV